MAASDGSRMEQVLLKLSSKKNTGDLFARLEVCPCTFSSKLGINRGETCFLLEPVSERHQPCCPSSAFFGCQVVQPRCDDRQSVQEGPKQPGPHELWRWRCRMVFGYWTPGSRTGKLSGWRLPAAVHQRLLTRAPLPGHAG